MAQTLPVFDVAKDGKMAPGPIGRLNAAGARSQSKRLKTFTANTIHEHSSQPKPNRHAILCSESRHL